MSNQNDQNRKSNSGWCFHSFGKKYDEFVVVESSQGGSHGLTLHISGGQPGGYSSHTGATSAIPGTPMKSHPCPHESPPPSYNTATDQKPAPSPLRRQINNELRPPTPYPKTF